MYVDKKQSDESDVIDIEIASDTEDIPQIVETKKDIKDEETSVSKPPGRGAFQRTK